VERERGNRKPEHVGPNAGAEIRRRKRSA
jgi:hypothetical protein